MKTKEQQARLKEIKQAKKDWKDTIRLNPEGFQKSRVELQSQAIDIKVKSKINHSYEITNEKEITDRSGKYSIGSYQGNYNLGYSCNLIILLK